MSFPGFSLNRQGPIRIGGSGRVVDFNLFKELGSPITVAPPGTIEIILENDFAHEGVTARDVSTENPQVSSTWKGAWRTGAWPEGTVIHLFIYPSVIITGKGGTGGDALLAGRVGGDNFGGGGGGMGTPPGAGGPATADALAGAVGTAEAGGAGGASGSGVALGFSEDGADGAHAMIVDDGVHLILENYGTIRGSGGGGGGGVPPPGDDDGQNGQRADGTDTDPERTAGENGAWICHNQNFLPGPFFPRGKLTKVITPVYPQVFGWEYQQGGSVGESPDGDIKTPKP